MDGQLSGDDLEKFFRDELRANGVRWGVRWKAMNDDERREAYGKLRLDREYKRIISEENRRRQAEPEPDDIPRVYDKEILDTAGNLNHGSGGGRRVIRGTKSLS